MLIKIISGGQTGADQAGLRAAKDLGLATGGWIPFRFKTETGSNFQLGQLYGLREHGSPHYAERTLLNVRESDGTVLFGRPESPGSKLTVILCEGCKKPCHTIVYPWLTGELPALRAAFLAWLAQANIRVLNVAGNRESVNTGIGAAVYDFLFKAITGAE